MTTNRRKLLDGTLALCLLLTVTAAGLWAYFHPRAAAEASGGSLAYFVALDLYRQSSRLACLAFGALTLLLGAVRWRFRR